MLVLRRLFLMLLCVGCLAGIPPPTASSEHLDPYDTVLEGTLMNATYSYYLYFLVRVEGQIREVVMENNDCYRDLQKDGHYTGVAAYRKFAKQLLRSKDTLQLALKVADYPRM